MDILKIRSIKTAQKEATIPIKAIMLFPSIGLLKLSKKIFTIIKLIAIKRRMLVKIFMIYKFENKNSKNCLYANNPLTLAANNLTAIAKSTMPKTFLMIFKPFSPSAFSIIAEDFKTKYTKIIFKSMAIMILIE